VSAYAVDSNFEAAVRAMETSRDSLLLTVVGELEVVNALELRLFRNEMTRQQVDACLDSFRGDLKSGVFILYPVPENAFERAVQLSLQTSANLGNRAGDILHVASA
jgi:hypothetical protein